MRIKELNHGRHLHLVQQFVKINIDSRRKVEQKKDHKIFPETMNQQAAIQKTIESALPLFMEPVFKAKDFDPL